MLNNHTIKTHYLKFILVFAKKPHRYKYNDILICSTGSSFDTPTQHYTPAITYLPSYTSSSEPGIFLFAGGTSNNGIK